LIVTAAFCFLQACWHSVSPSPNMILCAESSPLYGDWSLTIPAGRGSEESVKSLVETGLKKFSAQKVKGMREIFYMF
jgi:hypothetical protein